MKSGRPPLPSWVRRPRWMVGKKKAARMKRGGGSSVRGGRSGIAGVSAAASGRLDVTLRMLPE